MLKNLLYISFIFSLFACQNAPITTNEASEKEEVVMEDDSNSLPNEVDNGSTNQIADNESKTVVARKEFLASKHDTVQIIENTYYVYFKEGTSLYRNENFDSIDTWPAYGSKVTVLEKLKKETTDPVYGFKGYIWKVKTEKGTIGYLNSAVLSYIPFRIITDYKDLEIIFDVLHVNDSLLIEGTKSNDHGEGLWNRETSFFEHSINYQSMNDYTGLSQQLELPNMNVTQGFMFLDYCTRESLIESVLKNKFPQESFTRTVKIHENKTITVDAIYTNNELVQITFSIDNNEICIVEYTVAKVLNKENRIIISTGAYC